MASYAAARGARSPKLALAPFAAADDVVAAIECAFGGQREAWKELTEARSALISSGRKMLVSDAEHDV